MDKGRIKGSFWALLALVVAIGVLGTALAAGPSLAVKGGHGKGGRFGDPVVLTVNGSSSAIVSMGTTSIEISGSGFDANQMLGVGPRGVIPTREVFTDANGAFSFTYSPWDGGFNIPGPYPVDAFTYQGGNIVVLATTMFTVE